MSILNSARFSLLGFLALVSLIALKSHAGDLATSSESSPWTAMQKSCREFQIPGIFEIVRHGEEFSLALPGQIRAIREFTNNTCPIFLNHPNDTAAVRKFILDRDALASSTLSLELKGKGLKRYLEAAHDSISEMLLPSGLIFTDFNCGSNFWNLRKQVSESIRRLKVEAVQIQSLCFAANATTLLAARSRTSTVSTGELKPSAPRGVSVELRGSNSLNLQFFSGSETPPSGNSCSEQVKQNSDYENCLRANQTDSSTWVGMLKCGRRPEVNSNCQGHGGVPTLGGRS